MLLSRATGSVSSGNLSAFDVIGSKARKIARDDIVTIGNEESCPWQQRIRHQNSVAPYSVADLGEAPPPLFWVKKTKSHIRKKSRQGKQNNTARTPTPPTLSSRSGSGTVTQLLIVICQVFMQGVAI